MRNIAKPKDMGSRTGNSPGKNTGKTLTPKQQRFVDEYLIDLNGTQAAIRAGYAPGSAKVQASRLLTDANVIEALQNRKEDRARRTEITQDRVLQEVARLAFLDVRKAFDASGNLKPLHELDDDTAAAVAGLDLFEEYAGTGEERESIGKTKKLKLSDKTGALTLLMRHMGMLNDKMKLQGDPENPVQVATKVVIVPPKQSAQVETKPIPKDGA